MHQSDFDGSKHRAAEEVNPLFAYARWYSLSPRSQFVFRTGNPASPRRRMCEASKSSGQGNP
jgi:hypothetical protein